MGRKKDVNMTDNNNSNSSGNKKDQSSSSTSPVITTPLRPSRVAELRGQSRYVSISLDFHTHTPYVYVIRGKWI